MTRIYHSPHKARLTEHRFGSRMMLRPIERRQRALRASSRDARWLPIDGHRAGSYFSADRTPERCVGRSLRPAADPTSAAGQEVLHDT